MLPLSDVLSRPGVSSGGHPTSSGPPIRVLGKELDASYGKRKHVAECYAGPRTLTNSSPRIQQSQIEGGKCEGVGWITVAWDRDQ
jgi:hypothetical protein